VLPGGGRQPGWYARVAVPQEGLRWPTKSDGREDLPAWLPRPLAEDLELSYRQPTPGELPAFTLWECVGCTIPPPESRGVELAGRLSFLGFSAPKKAEAGEQIEVLTYWKVLTPPNRPLSIKLHLLGEGPLPLAVGDGLGFPSTGWERGDLFIQRHRIEIPDTLVPGTYRIHTGAYQLDDLTDLTTTMPRYSLERQIELLR